MKRHRLWIVALASVGVFSFLQYDHRAPKRNFSDFHVTYTTGKRFLAGEPIYVFNTGVSYFKYPPLYAFFMGPFSLLPERNAARLWHLLNLLFLCVLFGTVGRLLPGLEASRRPILYLFSGIASFRIILENLHEGQANLFMLTLLWGALYLFSKGKDLPGGFLFAFSILTKYFAVLFVPVLFLERRFKALFWTGVFLALLTALPATVVGFQRNLELLKECRAFLFESSLDEYSITTPPNQSLLACLNRWVYGKSSYGFHLLSLTRSQTFILYLSLSALLYAACLLLAWKARGKTDSFRRLAAFGAVSLCMSLFNPNAWRNAFLPLSVAYLVVIGYLLRVRWRDGATLAFLLLSFCLISLTSEFIVQEKGVKVTDLYSSITLGTFFLLGSLFKLGIRPKPFGAGRGHG